MAAVTVGRMNSKLGRGQGEDEPASARVGRRQAQHVREERTHLLGGRGEHDRMNAGNHAAILAATRSVIALRGRGWVTATAFGSRNRSVRPPGYLALIRPKALARP